jgi:hypothetical protein
MIKKTVISGNVSVLGIPKSHFAYYMARDFFDKGIAATNDLHRPKSKLTEKTHWMVCFPVCSIAFSLELALKGFLTDEQITNFRKKNGKRGHELSDLYKLIDIDTQNKIIKHFEECDSFRNSFFVVSYKPSTAKTSPKVYTSTVQRINTALINSNTSFQDFRYFYSLDLTKEYEFDFNTLVQFTHACLAVKAEELGIDYN